MIITFGELWESLKNYPRSINYYDKKRNYEENTITCGAETGFDYDKMKNFASEHCKDLVDDFSIYRTIDGFRLEVTLE